MAGFPPPPMPQGMMPPPGGPPGMPAGGPPPAAPGGAQPPGAAPPGGAMAGMPMQIMMLAFMAGAGISNMVQSLGKMRDIMNPAAKMAGKGVKADAAASNGMSLSPQIAGLMAQDPSMAAKLMMMVKQKLGMGGAPTGVM